ncbi:MAG: hypothetical protein LLG05_09575 [Porphyromonadaceae bacterium]|nr:hypothetical protein [Porphyromonadaceae bacterium]
MKVRLDINLKTASGAIISKGTIFSDEEGIYIPDFVMKRLQRRQATIISGGTKKVVASPAISKNPDNVGDSAGKTGDGAGKTGDGAGNDDKPPAVKKVLSKKKAKKEENK